MPRDQAGLAAGVSSTARQVGATLGVAIASVTLGAYTTGTTGGTGLAAASHAGWWLIVGYGVLTLALGFLVTTRWAAGTAAAAGTPADSGSVTPQAPARAA